MYSEEGHMNHPVDVVALFPSFLRALAQGCEVLSDAGLDVYLENERWYWRWTASHTHSARGFDTLEEAFVDALTYWTSPNATNVIRGRTPN